MSILKVAQMGHPVLRTPADEVSKDKINDSSFQNLIDDMVDTMREYRGVGLAAPQVHIAKKMIVTEGIANPRYPDAPDLPLNILVNPQITSYSSETQEGWEGCLSLDKLRGLVLRSTQITVAAQDRQGKALQIEVEGFLAIVLQHEIDHLNSTLFIDRMTNLKELYFLEEYERYVTASQEEEEEEE